MLFVELNGFSLELFHILFREGVTKSLDFMNVVRDHILAGFVGKSVPESVDGEFVLGVAQYGAFLTFAFATGYPDKKSRIGIFVPILRRVGEGGFGTGGDGADYIG